MKYIAEYDELTTQFQVQIFNDDGTPNGYLGSAPDKEAVIAMVSENVEKRKAVKKAIEFNDDGVITKDDTVKGVI